MVALGARPVRGPRGDTRLAFLAAIETGTSYRLLSLVALRPQERGRPKRNPRTRFLTPPLQQAVT